VKLELPCKPYPEILQGIRICNEKRRASQPLGQKSAGCIFKNPPGASAGRMIDELGLKGFAVGDGASERPPREISLSNAGHASAADHCWADCRRPRTCARGLWSYFSNTRWSFGTSEAHAAELFRGSRRRLTRNPTGPELVADEEPRYLAPPEAGGDSPPRKFSGKTWPFYRRVFLWTVIGRGDRSRRGLRGALCVCTRRKCSW